MTRITINNCVYYVHPNYDLYAANNDGNIIHIIKKVPQKGNKDNRGYLRINVRKYGGKQKRSIDLFMNVTMV